MKNAKKKHRRTEINDDKIHKTKPKRNKIENKKKLFFVQCKKLIKIQNR